MFDAEFMLCLVQLALVRVVGAGREVAGAPLLGAPGRDVVVGSPHCRSPPLSPGEPVWKVAGTTEGVQWVFCMLEINKSCSLPFKHSIPRGKRWYFCHNFPHSVLLEALLDYGARMDAFFTSVLIYLH